MSDTAIILIGGLGAALSWGIFDYIAAHATRKSGPITAVIASNIVGAIMFAALFALFFAGGSHQLTAAGVIYAVASGVLMGLAKTIFFIGIEKGPVSIVSPLAGLYPLVTTLIAVLIYGASLNIGQVAAIVMIVVGGMVAAGLLGVRKSERKLEQGPRLALLAVLFWGICFSFQAQAVAQLGWQMAAFINYEVLALTSFLVVPLSRTKETISRHTIWQSAKSTYVLGAATTGVVGLLFYNAAVTRDPSAGAIVTAISSASPLLTVFLALTYMKESVRRVALAGAVVGIAGVMMLALV